ncbi:DUF4302 domain-containing protein [Flavobacterium sp. 140616W15]|uniref:DUF4302 domain-containing protein n=1 Tax=Flavobacterium sp. 140616W15 TaxID=2478552 RepID=UPI000F0CF7B0|nr:DUF4302 domain-containing protein [Flavobacterium sp. 140616W15]AYN04326.1 DUF4302 domain-containing protein [Flavobacterium sp. 140616W15]
MKIKNIFSYLIVAIFALQLVACTNTDTEQKFDQTPTERTNAQKKELNDLLLSSEYGWKAIYFTDSTQLGGFTHLFKFLPNGKVNMASDFNTDTKMYNSQYEIQLGSTVSVVFTTASRIHLLSDSNNFPTAALRGKGYLGDFQFLYYGQDKEDIIFRTNRTVQELRFVKATAEDWSDLNKNAITLNNINGTATSPLFRLLVTNDGTATHNFDFDFNTNARFGEATSLDPTYDESYNFGFSYTPTGAIAKPAVVVKGQKLANFIFDSVNNSFVATGRDGVSATIKYTNTPPTLTDDYKVLLPGKVGARFGYFPDDLTAGASTNSQFFIDELAKINASLPDGITLGSVQLYLNHSLGNFIYYTFNGRSAVFHYIDVEEDAVGKKIIFKHKSWNGNTTSAAPSFLASFDKNLVNASGVYVKKENFRLTYANSVYTFTSSVSSFRMTTWLL